jgi:ubiquinone/menaquinone biosynthesis C-methylase UbiE
MPNESVAFDRAADYYDRTRGFPPGVEDEIASLMATAGGFTSSSRILEIGVGTGRIALPLAKHVGAYVGVDLSLPMMDRLRAKQTNQRIFVLEADATRLPFPDHCFDGVVAVHVFHLIPDWRSVLREVARVLRPGAPLVHGGNGRLISDTLQNIWRKATDEAQEAKGAIPPTERETFLAENGWREASPAHSHRFIFQRSPLEFVSLLEQRCWSSTWRMSDEQMARGLAAVREYIAAHYDDSTAQETFDSRFNVQAYLPPQTT